MKKKLLVLISILAIFFLFLTSFGFVLIKKAPKEEVYFPTPTIEKVYCIRPKSFPAPYEFVGGLPRL